MAATTIEWSSFLHPTITVSVSALQDIINIKRLVLRWKCNCSVVSSVDSEIGRSNEVYKILSVLNKIMPKILWSKKVKGQGDYSAHKSSIISR